MHLNGILSILTTKDGNPGSDVIGLMGIPSHLLCRDFLSIFIDFRAKIHENKNGILAQKLMFCLNVRWKVYVASSKIVVAHI